LRKTGPPFPHDALAAKILTMEAIRSTIVQRSPGDAAYGSYKTVP
jgi:hypothetical protein